MWAVLPLVILLLSPFPSSVPTVATLLHVGWKPIQANHWISSERDWQARVGSSPWEDATITKAVEESAEQEAWARASMRLGSEDLKQGKPCWDGVKAAVKRLRKLGLLDQARSLETAAVGGAPVGCRFQLNQHCPRCGTAEETHAHRYFQCPANAEESAWSSEEWLWLGKTQWPAKAIERAAGAHQLLWTRAVLPFNLSHRLAIPEPEDGKHRSVVGAEELGTRGIPAPLHRRQRRIHASTFVHAQSGYGSYLV